MVRDVTVIDPALSFARAQLAGALRSRVAGDDAERKAATIWLAEGPRWFTPDDPIWRVHADASMFPAGLRALLLQSLHPLAMAGVAAHSGYQGDPWGRLQRTSEFLATTTFGTIEHAERQIARVRAIHARVRGTAPDGRPYAASDPHLLAWVHVTEADSFLTAFQRYAAQPLSAEEADRYVAQTGFVNERLGVVEPPRTVAELRAAIESYRPELRSTPEARAAARFLLVHPPLPLAARPGYAALAAGAVAMLPLWARLPLRLPYLPITERVVSRPVGGLATALVRWAMHSPEVARHRAIAATD
ncbi:MAG TPA: oxygenase MpaB family protein [Pedococcus sp.]|uniref:oxygenase MpaB family protein n=1 Tax=Pedococcus sp. TaxID=2860345 RepID=UPI002F9435E6